MTPTLEHIYTATILIGERLELGHRRGQTHARIAILGGEFSGAKLRGKVLPGGYDRQVRRTDGIRELEAVYDMETDDGCVISINNRVVVDEEQTPQRYARSVVSFQACDEHYRWLNRQVFVGTLERLPDEPARVQIEVYAVR